MEKLLEKVSYLDRPRGYGQGDVRVGEHIDVGEDIYSLGFISQISDEIMDKHFDVIKGELINFGKKKKEAPVEQTTVPSSINADVSSPKSPI